MLQRSARKALSADVGPNFRRRLLRSFSPEATSAATLLENDISLPSLSSFDYSPPPYTGPSAAEIHTKRKEFLNPSTFTFYNNHILVRDGEQIENEKWVSLIGDIAGCVSIKRPKEIPYICLIFNKSLNHQEEFQREAAAAALSAFISYRLKNLSRNVRENLSRLRKLV